MCRMLNDGGPETMVNTEVWLPAGFSLEFWLSGHHVVNGGPLGSSGRYIVMLPSVFLSVPYIMLPVVVCHPMSDIDNFVAK